MTNGEKIKEMFPNIIKYGNILIDDTGALQKNILFDDTWWNSEYKEPNKSENPNSSITKNDLGVDAVSRKDVHDMLENLPITVEDKWFNWLQKACMRLAELPSVTPQELRWIPASERLPKAYEFVNCTCHSLIDDREDWVVETCYIPQLPNSPYSDWGNIPMLNSCECKVIAWMHRDIPKPYKAESEKT